MGIIRLITQRRYLCLIGGVFCIIAWGEADVTIEEKIKDC